MLLTQLEPILMVVFIGVVTSLGTWIYIGFRGNPKPRAMPTRWPLVGMLPSQLMNLHNFYEWLTEILAANGGNFQFFGPKYTKFDSLFTSDPHNLEYILKDNFTNFIKGENWRYATHEILGKGILGVDGDQWRVQRNVFSSHINSNSHRRFSDSVIISGVDDKLVPVLRQLSMRVVPVDLQDLMLRFTFDTTCHIGFGAKTEYLTAELPEVPFAKAFKEAFDCAMHRFFSPPRFRPLIRWLKLGKEKIMPAMLKVMDDFVSQIISNRRKLILTLSENDDSANNGHDVDLLSCLMKLELYNDDKTLKDACLNFLLAGSDTTALTLTWLFWLLATHPEKEEKVVEEIRYEMELANGRLSRESLNRMNYLHAAINESLRLYPVVPIVQREVIEDDVLPGGQRVYRGHQVFYCLYSMGRMESIWGADCREFRPERWLSARNGGELVHVSPFKFLTFHAGPRNCLGKDMAYMVIKAVACRVLQHFHVSLLPNHVVEPKVAPTLAMKNGLLVTLHNRSNIS